MLSLLPAQSMYSATAVQFRNPFVSGGHPLSAHYNYDEDFSVESPLTKAHYHVKRPLTPPLDMSSVAPYQARQHQEHGNRYGEEARYQAATNTMYQDSRNANLVKYEQKSSVSASSRPRSPPVSHPNTQPLVDSAHQRKISQGHAIAPSLQIPRSVNNSQGSLSELAAQITCLFWFESASTLEQAEKALMPLQPLVPDAIPTTGFRKWVTTILSTTQVAQNVIILALLFIYRLKKINPSVKGKPGSEYRLLTVALMLGNKFLDDNTYTNKTWAEVSGISVMEVHIMEVEFLSNMKYALYTSKEEWTRWQTQLGKFAYFVEQAMKPHTFAPALASVAAPQLPLALPSPPASNQASPPYTTNSTPNHYYGAASQNQIPKPSSLGPLPELVPQSARKRSLDDHSSEPAPKRMATSTPGYLNAYAYDQSHGSASLSQAQQQQVQRVTLPSLQIPQSYPAQTSSTQQMQSQLHAQLPQLPPLNYPARPTPMTYPSTNTWSQAPAIPAPAMQYSQPASQLQSNQQSRHQSPYAESRTVSPQSASSQQHPTSQLSPSYFLAQRNSPYRPIRGVSTLLVPPPSKTQQPQQVPNEQMHYQPLGRPIQDQQQGRLPYIAQNQWFDGHHQQPATPVTQWPAFFHPHQQPQLQHRQTPVSHY